MNITDSRIYNRCNLERVAAFIRADSDVVLAYYDELIADEEVLADINREIAFVRSNYDFVKGIFRMPTIDNVDWFAFQRVLLYVLTRLRRPRHVLETGVFYGGNAAFILRALQRNEHGRLVSIDLPDTKIDDDARQQRHPDVRDSESYNETLQPGFMIPSYLRDYWQFIEGDSLAVIPTLKERFELYIHDSEHSYEFMKTELTFAKSVMTTDGIMLADDIDWSNGFYAFATQERLVPLLLTDNGKDSLRVRTGLVDLAHPQNGVRAVTG